MHFHFFELYFLLFRWLGYTLSRMPSERRSRYLFRYSSCRPHPPRPRALLLAHLSRRIGDQRMTVLQCYKKPRIGHDFRDDTLHLQQFFFCQVILRSMNKKSLDDARPFLQPGPENPGQMFCNQAGTTLLACCPFCPRVTSKVTF